MEKKTMARMTRTPTISLRRTTGNPWCTGKATGAAADPGEARECVDDGTMTSTQE